MSNKEILKEAEEFRKILDNIEYESPEYSEAKKIMKEMRRLLRAW